MRFISFCALAGTALLAGNFAVADSAEPVVAESLDIKDGLDAFAEAAVSPEVSDGITLTKEQEGLLAEAQSQGFEAEVSRMMKIIINSIYKDKEIFLRELISNASDALDKLRLKLLTDEKTQDTTSELRVRIRSDMQNNVLHIEDNGIGMTKDELVTNLGTIAKSGTAEFMEKIESAKQEGQEASQLIGQFGVGFYSAFLVADKIVVASKADGDDQHVWTSDATNFSCMKDPRGNTLERGTRISLYLKPEAKEYLHEMRLSALVGKYSEFIDFPIYAWKSKEVPVAVEASDATDASEDEAAEGEATEENGDGDEDTVSEDDDGEVENDDDKEEEEEEVATETVWDYEVMNAQKPIWTRDPKTVEKEEYEKFYESFDRTDTFKPMAYSHFTADSSEISFRSILYTPSAESMSYGQQEIMAKQSGRNIKLYVNKVFITDDLPKFVPRYLWFIKGLVDSSDLPLTVSRENLQQHKLLKVIKKKVTRKALEMFKDLSVESEEKYMEFFNVHASNLKLGLIEDNDNKNRLAHLMRFRSSKSGEKSTSLEKYVEGIKEGQTKIYYVACSEVEECMASPFIEQLTKKDFEVLYLVDALDEYAIRALPEYKEMNFVNVAKEDLKFDDKTEENKARKAHFEELDTAFAATKTYLKDVNPKIIGRVVVSTRLEESPCVLSASQFGMSGNMQRIMDSQTKAQQDPSVEFYSSQKKTLEINPRHPLIKKLRELVDAKETTDETKDLGEVLVDAAMIRSGFDIKDQVAFSGRIERMLRLSMGVGLDETVEEAQEFAENPVVEEHDEEADAVEVDADEVAMETAEAAEAADEHEEL